MKKLSLTFDDGPHPVHTPAILDILARHKVPATFFPIGEHVFFYPDIVKQAERAGHRCENHTWHHLDMRGRDWPELEKEIGGWGKYFRPPGGQYDEGVLSYLELYGIKLALWDADGFSHIPGITADGICAAVDDQITSGGEDGYGAGSGIILLHDGDSASPNGNRWATVEATDRIITKYKAHGYEFVSLDQMTLPGTPRRTSL